MSAAVSSRDVRQRFSKESPRERSTGSRQVSVSPAVKRVNSVSPRRGSRRVISPPKFRNVDRSPSLERFPKTEVRNRKNGPKVSDGAAKNRSQNVDLTRVDSCSSDDNPTDWSDVRDSVTNLRRKDWQNLNDSVTKRKALPPGRPIPLDLLSCSTISTKFTQDQYGVSSREQESRDDYSTDSSASYDDPSPKARRRLPFFGRFRGVLGRRQKANDIDEVSVESTNSSNSSRRRNVGRNATYQSVSVVEDTLATESKTPQSPNYSTSADDDHVFETSAPQKANKAAASPKGTTSVFSSSGAASLPQSKRTSGTGVSAQNLPGNVASSTSRASTPVSKRSTISTDKSEKTSDAPMVRANIRQVSRQRSSPIPSRASLATTSRVSSQINSKQSGMKSDMDSESLMSWSVTPANRNYWNPFGHCNGGYDPSTLRPEDFKWETLPDGKTARISPRDNSGAGQSENTKSAFAPSPRSIAEVSVSPKWKESDGTRLRQCAEAASPRQSSQVVATSGSLGTNGVSAGKESQSLDRGLKNGTLASVLAMKKEGASMTSSISGNNSKMIPSVNSQNSGHVTASSSKNNDTAVLQQTSARSLSGSLTRSYLKTHRSPLRDRLERKQSASNSNRSYGSTSKPVYEEAKLSTGPHGTNRTPILSTSTQRTGDASVQSKKERENVATDSESRYDQTKEMKPVSRRPATPGPTRVSNRDELSETQASQNQTRNVDNDVPTASILTFKGRSLSAPRLGRYRDTAARNQAKSTTNEINDKEKTNNDPPVTKTKDVIDVTDGNVDRLTCNNDNLIIIPTKSLSNRSELDQYNQSTSTSGSLSRKYRDMVKSLGASESSKSPIGTNGITEGTGGFDVEDIRVLFPGRDQVGSDGKNESPRSHSSLRQRIMNRSRSATPSTRAGSYSLDRDSRQINPTEGTKSLQSVGTIDSSSRTRLNSTSRPQESTSMDNDQSNRQLNPRSRSLTPTSTSRGRTLMERRGINLKTSTNVVSPPSPAERRRRAISANESSVSQSTIHKSVNEATLEKTVVPLELTVSASSANTKVENVTMGDGQSLDHPKVSNELLPQRGELLEPMQGQPNPLGRGRIGSQVEGSNSPRTSLHISRESSRESFVQSRTRIWERLAATRAKSTDSSKNSDNHHQVSTGRTPDEIPKASITATQLTKTFGRESTEEVTQNQFGYNDANRGGGVTNLERTKSSQGQNRVESEEPERLVATQRQEGGSSSLQKSETAASNRTHTNQFRSLSAGRSRPLMLKELRSSQTIKTNTQPNDSQALNKSQFDLERNHSSHGNRVVSNDSSVPVPDDSVRREYLENKSTLRGEDKPEPSNHGKQTARGPFWLRRVSPLRIRTDIPQSNATPEKQSATISSPSGRYAVEEVTEDSLNDSRLVDASKSHPLEPRLASTADSIPNPGSPALENGTEALSPKSGKMKLILARRKKSKSSLAFFSEGEDGVDVTLQNEPDNAPPQNRVWSSGLQRSPTPSPRYGSIKTELGDSKTPELQNNAPRRENSAGDQSLSSIHQTEEETHALKKSVRFWAPNRRRGTSLSQSTTTDDYSFEKASQRNRDVTTEQGVVSLDGLAISVPGNLNSEASSRVSPVNRVTEHIGEPALQETKDTEAVANAEGDSKTHPVDDILKVKETAETGVSTHEATNETVVPMDDDIKSPATEVSREKKERDMTESDQQHNSFVKGELDSSPRDRILTKDVTTSLESPRRREHRTTGFSHFTFKMMRLRRREEGLTGIAPTEDSAASGARKDVNDSLSHEIPSPTNQAKTALNEKNPSNVQEQESDSLHPENPPTATEIDPLSVSVTGGSSPATDDKGVIENTPQSPRSNEITGIEESPSHAQAMSIEVPLTEQPVDRSDKASRIIRPIGILRRKGKFSGHNDKDGGEHEGTRAKGSKKSKKTKSSKLVTPVPASIPTKPISDNTESATHNTEKAKKVESKSEEVGLTKRSDDSTSDVARAVSPSRWTTMNRNEGHPGSTTHTTLPVIVSEVKSLPPTEIEECENGFDVSLWIPPDQRDVPKLVPFRARYPKYTAGQKLSEVKAVQQEKRELARAGSDSKLAASKSSDSKKKVVPRKDSKMALAQSMSGSAAERAHTSSSSHVLAVSSNDSKKSLPSSTRSSKKSDSTKSKSRRNLLATPAGETVEVIMPSRKDRGDSKSADEETLQSLSKSKIIQRLQKEIIEETKSRHSKKVSSEHHSSRDKYEKKSEGIRKILKEEGDLKTSGSESAALAKGVRSMEETSADESSVGDREPDLNNKGSSVKSKQQRPFLRVLSNLRSRTLNSKRSEATSATRSDFFSHSTPNTGMSTGASTGMSTGLSSLGVTTSASEASQSTDLSSLAASGRRPATTTTTTSTVKSLLPVVEEDPFTAANPSSDSIRKVKTGISTVASDMGVAAAASPSRLDSVDLGAASGEAAEYYPREAEKLPIWLEIMDALERLTLSGSAIAIKKDGTFDFSHATSVDSPEDVKDAMQTIRRHASRLGVSDEELVQAVRENSSNNHHHNNNNDAATHRGLRKIGSYVSDSTIASGDANQKLTLTSRVEEFTEEFFDMIAGYWERDETTRNNNNNKQGGRDDVDLIAERQRLKRVQRQKPKSR